MSILWAVIGGVLGAVAGTVAGFLVGVAAAEIFNISDFEGASGYFVVFGFALPGLVIGLIFGIYLELARARKRKLEASSTTARTAVRFLAALAVIAGAVVAGTWIYVEIVDDTVAGTNQATPVLHYQVRLPPGTAVPEDRKAVNIHLWTAHIDAFGNLNDDWRKMEGDRPVIRGWFELYLKTSDRVMSVRLAETASAAHPEWHFRLRLARTPGHMKEYSPWYPVDSVDEGGANLRVASSKDLPEIRYRLVYAGYD